MEGFQEKLDLSVESNHPVEDNKKEEQKLGLGFENPNLDDQTLDHQLESDQEDGVCQKLGEMGIQKKDCLIGGEVDGSGVKIDVEGEKSDEGEKIDVEGGKSDEDYKKIEIEGENSDEGFEKKDFEGDVKDGGDVGEVDDTKGEVEGEKIEVKGDGDEFVGVKEGGFEKEGSKWSEIEEEEEGKESGGFEVNKDEGFVGENEDITNGYGDGWDEKWNDGAGKNEAYEGQQFYDDYENVGYQKEQYDGEERWHRNVEGRSLGFNDGNNGSVQYPLRPDAEDCSFYMKTGACKFGSNCKFNHPLRRKNQASRDMFKQREEYFDRPGPTECKYHSTPGGCKYGKACRYNHGRPKPAVAPITEFNFLGLPIRKGERECPYYMKTSSCKYGPSCRFNHPDPTVVGGGDPASQGSIKDSIPGWSSARPLNENGPYMPVMYPPSPTAPPNGKWNEYQAPVYPTSERSLPPPPAYALRPMNIPATDANFYAYPRTQLILDDFPERPGQPECSFYLKTGDCKYRAACKFHHPKPRKPTFTLSDRGLPLRPDQGICSNYSRYGICKYGPACRYDHPVSNSNSAESDQGQPRRYGRLGDSDGNWRREPVQH